MTSGDNPGQHGAGGIYSAMVGNLVTAEFNRRKSLEARGATIVATATAMLTIIFGLTVIVTGKDYVFSNTCAQFFLGAALTSFVASAVLAIVVQTYGFKYTVIGPETLRSITNENWDRSAEDAQRMWIRRQVNTVISLRETNDTRADLVAFSLGCHVAAILLLTASIVFELSSRAP